MQKLVLAKRLLIAFVAINLQSLVTAEWGYEGDNEKPDEWYKEFPFCAGDEQSPIDVVCEDTIYRNVDGPVISTLSYGDATLTNNMHSSQWAPGNGMITLTGPTLNGVYKLAQTHFHWGKTRNVGSEHLFNGLRASFEMHMVFIADQYSSFTEATQANVEGGIAVVAVLFEETNIDNMMLDPVVQNLDLVDEPNKTANVPYINFDGIDTSKVFEYEGSLTTPTCTEIVHWFLLPQLHSIGDSQIAAFRRMLFLDNTSMGNNYRPVQNLNGREVFRNFKSCRRRFIAEY